jgi:hypothetical protein
MIFWRGAIDALRFAQHILRLSLLGQDVLR